MFDVAYLLAGSMSVEERRATEVDIVRAWYDALGAPGGYSLRRRLARVPAHLDGDDRLRVIPAAQMDPANERGRELIEAMAVRSFTACLDLEAIELLP